MTDRIVRKRIVRLLIWICLLFSFASAQAEDLAVIDIDQVPELSEGLKEKVEVMLDTEGEQSMKISYEGSQAISIPLYTIALPEIEDCVLMYHADIRSENVKEKAYLEMLCVFGKNQEYFSRALDDALIGTTDWRRSQTPFYLRKGEKPEKARLGIRMEGPGTVWVRSMKLTKQESGLFTVPGSWEWIPGTLLGIFGGIYGGLAGSLASRGKGKAIVQAMSMFLIIVSIIMLIASFILLAIGASWGAWYALMLPGILGIIVITPVYRNILNQYQQVELQKMKAMDVME